MTDLVKGGVFSQTETSAWRGAEESNLDLFLRERGFLSMQHKTQIAKFADSQCKLVR